MLSRRAAKLEKRRRRLAEQPRSAHKLEAINQLVGGVAHDFNNLLMGIGGYAQMLLADAEPESGAAKDLSRIHELARRGAELTKDLQLLNRRDHPERIALDLNSVVEEARKMLQRLLPGNITMEVRLAARPAPVLADAGQLRHVLFSLAVNARESMPAGGRFLVEVGHADLEPAVSGLEPGRYVLLAVTDAGCEKNQAARQLGAAPSPASQDIDKGTGLGLAAAYEIVRQHDGRVTVHGEPGRGTTFKIYLPCFPEGTMEKKGEPHESRVEENPHRGGQSGHQQVPVLGACEQRL